MEAYSTGAAINLVPVPRRGQNEGPTDNNLAVRTGSDDER